MLPTPWPFIYRTGTVLNSINDSEVYGLDGAMNNLKMWFVDITREGYIVNLDAALLNS